MAAMGFLAGLPSDYETAKSQVLSSAEVALLKDTFSRVLRTESSQPPQLNSALVSRRSMAEFGRQSYKSGGKEFLRQNPGVTICHYCHKPGHMKRDCRKLQNKTHGICMRGYYKWCI